MTGPEIRALRTQLGFRVVEFAQLLGVASSTMSRWEAQGRWVTMDPLQAQLFVVLVRALDTHEASVRLFADSLREALVLGGPLRAIHALLSTEYGDAS